MEKKQEYIRHEEEKMLRAIKISKWLGKSLAYQGKNKTEREFRR